MPKNRRKFTRWTLIDKPGPGARVIGHLRVSTGRQVDKYSLPEQRRKIEELCAYEGWIIVGWCIEAGVSAKDDFDSRPEWKKLIFEQAGRDCDVILCHDYKRWCRNQVCDLQSLEELRRRGVWWQTIEDKIDINHDQETGKDVIIGVNRVLKAAYVRELAKEIHKGKEGKARKGLSNGYPVYGYRFPTITLQGPLKVSEVVFEPDPKYFPILQELGRLGASQPILSGGAIARQLNETGYRNHIYTQPGMEYLFTGDAILKLLERPYYHAYSPESDRGTIITPEGEVVQGKHQAAWSYELSQQIKANRQKVKEIYGDTGNHFDARGIRIRVFTGFLSCAFCFRRMRATYAVKVRSATTWEQLYYRCNAKNRGAYCKTADLPHATTSLNQGYTSMREEVLAQQMELLLAQMVHHADETREKIKQKYLEASLEAEPVQVVDYERIRRELEEQKKRAVTAWIRRQLAEEDKDEIVAEIDEEIAKIPRENEIQEPVEKKLAVVSAIETAYELWQATKNLPLDRAATNRRAALSKIIEPFGIVCDSFKHQIVGLRLKPNCREVVALMLASEEWKERPDNLLWCDDPNFPELETKQGLVERIYRALAEGYTTSNDIAEHIFHELRPGIISNVLIRAFRYGLVTRVRQSTKGKDGYYYRYTLISTLEDWKGKVWFSKGRKRPYHGL